MPFLREAFKIVFRKRFHSVRFDFEEGGQTCNYTVTSPEALFRQHDRMTQY
jgi:hypothetical protein